jgi:hypothetical protein
MYLESAEVKLLARVFPPVGTVIQNASLPGGGTGTIAGLSSIAFDLQSCQTNGGTWTLSGTGFTGTTGNTWGLRSGWTFGSAGTPQTSGDVLSISAGQFPIAPASANAANPVAEIWRGKWDTASWAIGPVHRWAVNPSYSSILVRVMVNGTPEYSSIQAQSIPSLIDIKVDPGPYPCWPISTVTPQDSTGFLGHAAIFHGSALFATSCPPLAYQWRRGCTDLVDDGRITGSTTDTLKIDPVLASDAGQYDIRLNSEWWAGPAWLRLGCYANCDQSTSEPILNANDFQCFLNKFAAGDSYANCDGSTAPPVLNANDFQCFLNNFAAGCS